LCHAGVLIEVEDRAPIDRAISDRGCAFLQCNRRSDRRIAKKLKISATLIHWRPSSDRCDQRPQLLGYHGQANRNGSLPCWRRYRLTHRQIIR